MASANKGGVIMATMRTKQKSDAMVSVARPVLTGQALLDDMAAFRKQVNATPETARAFLIELGLLTKSGKPKQLIK